MNTLGERQKARYIAQAVLYFMENKNDDLHFGSIDKIRDKKELSLNDSEKDISEEKKANIKYMLKLFE